MVVDSLQDLQVSTNKNASLYTKNLDFVAEFKTMLVKISPDFIQKCILANSQQLKTNLSNNIKRLFYNIKSTNVAKALIQAQRFVALALDAVAKAKKIGTSTWIYLQVYKASKKVKITANTGIAICNILMPHIIITPGILDIAKDLKWKYGTDVKYLAGITAILYGCAAVKNPTFAVAGSVIMLIAWLVSRNASQYVYPYATDFTNDCKVLGTTKPAATFQDAINICRDDANCKTWYWSKANGVSVYHLNRFKVCDERVDYTYVPISQDVDTMIGYKNENGDNTTLALFVIFTMVAVCLKI